MIKSLVKLLRNAANDLSVAKDAEDSDVTLQPAYAGGNPGLLSDVALRHTKRTHCCSGAAQERCEDVVDLRFREIHAKS